MSCNITIYNVFSIIPTYHIWISPHCQLFLWQEDYLEKQACFCTALVGFLKISDLFLSVIHTEIKERE